MRLNGINSHRAWSNVGAAVCQHGISRTIGVFKKVIPDIIRDGEAVRHVLPVGFCDDKSRSVFGGPFHHLLAPERPEMDVFDPPDIPALIYEQACFERVAVQSAYEVAACGHSSKIY